MREHIMPLRANTKKQGDGANPLGDDFVPLV